MLQRGKYKGFLFAEVAALDKPYSGWVMSLPASSKGFQKFSTYLRMNHGGLLRVGKHKGKYFNEVLQDDPQYAEWVASVGDPTASLGEFAEYIRENKRNTAPHVGEPDQSTIPMRPERWRQRSTCPRPNITMTPGRWRQRSTCRRQGSRAGTPRETP